MRVRPRRGRARFLGGDGKIVVESPNVEVGRDPSVSEAYDCKREKGFADLERVRVPVLPILKRYQGCPEVDLCYGDEQAVSEAKRCLQCDMEIRLAKGH